MPFTVAHAAAVLPFRKLKLVWSAFIIGSMAPDFPYIVGNVKYRDLGHFWPGVLYFTLPVSLAVLWLFHTVFKRPVIGLLPSGMQARLRRQAGPFRFGPLRRFVLILISTALGIASHLVWDTFTHSQTWAWREFRWLQRSIHVPLLGTVPAFAVAQYGSTIIGTSALALWTWFWYRSSQPVLDPAAPVRSRFPLAVAMFAIAGVVGLIRAVLIASTPITRANINLFLLVFAVTSLALAFWQLFAYCVLVSTHQVW
jgi:uncharacterized protein DUF4184